MPTILEAASIRPPALWGDGKPVPPAPGHSLMPLFAHEGAVTHDSQGWHHEGNRALRVGNWKIVAAGKESEWELYDLTSDRSETRNLAQAEPERVNELATIWNRQNEEYTTLATKDLPKE